MTREVNFESPSFFKRIKGMLGVDFYRLFHTPLFYIFLAISALIPAIILGSASIKDPETGKAAEALYTNVWNIIAANKPVYAVSSIAEYANMNMVFIFGGIMVSIFIGHDYKSGYVKQLFTTHAKKQDYLISKSLTCAFAMACMCVTYIIGAVCGGLFSNASFEVNVGNLIFAILGKMVMSLGWASLYTFLNVIFRKYFGISIASSFFFGTGILIILAAAIVGLTPLPDFVLNVFLYGSSVYACLSSNILTLIVCAVCSAFWWGAYVFLGTLVLSKSDVY